MGVSAPTQITKDWSTYLLRLVRCALGAATLHYGHHLCRRSTRCKSQHGFVSGVSQISA
jgi:hypothetical protein